MDKDVCKHMKYGEKDAIIFDCPGCGHAHLVTTGPGNWKFNGDMKKPTINPSIKAEWEWGEERHKKVCHSFVENGNIKFLNDCTHHLAGKTVKLSPID